MDDLLIYIDTDLMIAAARRMGEQADDVDTQRRRARYPLPPPSAFGAQGGTPDYPTSYSTMRIYDSGFLFFPDKVFMEHATFERNSDAPWADELLTKWRDSIYNRTNEADDIQGELATQKLCIMQYLADTGEVDLEAAGLLEAVDPGPYGPGGGGGRYQEFT